MFLSADKYTFILTECVNLKMPRWTGREVVDMKVIRERLADLLQDAPPFPEVVGDRKIIRFLRGHDHNIDKICDLYGKFLRWRKEAKVDEIRNSIVEGGLDHPLRFPKGELIMHLIPSLAIAPDALDNLGCPIVVDQYKFHPHEVLNQITIPEYVLFVTHALEYRQCILEQMSEERERAYLASLSDEERARVDHPDCTDPPYGVITQTCVIRDLDGVGFEHLSVKGREIIQAVVSLASDNYPEMMRKTFMINVPWVFNTVWYFIKGNLSCLYIYLSRIFMSYTISMLGLLAAKTVSKITLYGGTFIDEIAKEIPHANLPSLVGGSYVGYQNYVSFPFDRSYFNPATVLASSSSSASAVTVATVGKEEEAKLESISLDDKSTAVPTSSSSTDITPKIAEEFKDKPAAGVAAIVAQQQPGGGGGVGVEDISLISLTTVGH